MYEFNAKRSSNLNLKSGNLMDSSGSLKVGYQINENYLSLYLNDNFVGKSFSEKEIKEKLFLESIIKAILRDRISIRFDPHTNLFVFLIFSVDDTPLLISRNFHSYEEAEEYVSTLRKVIKKDRARYTSHRKYNSDEVAITNISDFISALDNFEKEQGVLYFYRGHSKRDYKLLPSIYRNKELVLNEHTMFKEIQLKCPNDFLGVENTFQSLVKMQHYSLPTRLLDITSNPLMALYFSVSNTGSWDEDGELFVFGVPRDEIKYYDSDTVALLANISLVPKISDQIDDKFLTKLYGEILKEKPYFRNSFKPNSLNSVICVKGKMDNDRIIRQDGAFFIFGIKNKSFDAPILPVKYRTSVKNKRSMIIKASAKESIYKQLELLGINESNVYPEIDKVANFIKSKYSI